MAAACEGTGRHSARGWNVARTLPPSCRPIASSPRSVPELLVRGGGRLQSDPQGQGPGARLVAADITFDNSYPTGGEALTPADLGLRDILSVAAEQKGVVSRLCEYDYTTQKLKLFTALSTEAANASDQSTITVRVLALGM